MDIRNTTKLPLKVPLPGGKLLRLGPGKVGQITPKASEHPPVQALIASGQVLVVGEGKSQAGPGTHHSSGPTSSPSSGASGGMRHTGDR